MSRTTINWQGILLETQRMATEAMSQSYEMMSISCCTSFFLKGLPERTHTATSAFQCLTVHSSITAIPIPQMRFTTPSTYSSALNCSRGLGSGALEHRSKSTLDVGCQCPGHRTRCAIHKTRGSKE